MNQTHNDETTEPKITKLTEEQEALMEAIRDKWIAIGLSCEQSTHEQQRAAVNLSYRDADLSVPEYHFFFDSPHAGRLAVAVLTRYYEQFPEEDRDTIEPPDFLHDRVATYMELDKNGEALPFDIAALMEEALEWVAYGQHDVGQLALFDYSKQIGVEGLKVDGLMATAQHCGWWWPMENIAVITAKMSELHQDGGGQLHCTTGMATKYPDGWGICMLHGCRVPRRFIEDPAAVQDHDIADIVHENKMTTEEKETFTSTVTKLRTAALTNTA